MFFPSAAQQRARVEHRLSLQVRSGLPCSLAANSLFRKKYSLFE
jgi:hypothetical protein